MKRILIAALPALLAALTLSGCEGAPSAPPTSSSNFPTPTATASPSRAPIPVLVLLSASSVGLARQNGLPGWNKEDQ